MRFHISSFVRAVQSSGWLTRCLRSFFVPALAIMLAGRALAQVDAPPAPAATQAAQQQDASWTLVEDEWYVMEIAGAKAGYTNIRTEKSGDRYRTTTSSSLEMGRGGAAVKIMMDSAFTETAAGEPVLLESTQDMAKQRVVQRWEFLTDAVLYSSTQGDRTQRKSLGKPQGEWLTPVKADKFAKQQRAQKVQEFSLRTVDPQGTVTDGRLKPIKLQSKLVREDVLEVDGEQAPVTVWSSSTDLLPVWATEYYDADGELLLQEMNTGMGKIAMRRATKPEAMADAGDGPELLLQSFVTPDKPIDNPMKARRARLRLTARDGELPELPSAGAQRVEMSDDRRSAVLTIDIHDNAPATEGDRNDQQYAEATTMVDADDALVKALSEKPKDDDPMAIAEALRTLVHKHISRKGMATAFASASETARTKTGDCSEHGVLLCAMLRARDIPARVAMGLIYADQFAGAEGIFGWHMWTQALIDGKWVDFDATLPVRYNAAHVLTNVSSLSDGLGATDMASILQLIGNVDIEVLEVKHAD